MEHYDSAMCKIFFATLECELATHSQLLRRVRARLLGTLQDRAALQSGVSIRNA